MTRHPLRRPPLDPLAAIRFQRDVQHLHSLGARAMTEALLEIADRIGGLPAIGEVLTKYKRFSPELLHAVGGDRFVPRQLDLVPPDYMEERHDEHVA